MSFSGFCKKVAKSSIDASLSLFFIFIFLVQSFSCFAYLENSKQNSFFESPSYNHLDISSKTFIEPVTDESDNHSLSLEAEDQFPEEDEFQENSNGSSYENISQNYVIEELYHSYSCNIQFLRQNSSCCQFIQLPLFILHHNWKNYLS